jgi:hypothetical protein
MRYARGKTIGHLLMAALVATSCQSDLVGVDESGAVITLVDDGAALQSAHRFVLPDTIVRLSPSGAGMGREATSAIVASVRAQLVRLGWTDVTATPTAQSDVIVLIAAAERIESTVAYGDWYVAWGYLPYWSPSVSSASVWGVPAGSIPVAFEAGTILITMLDLRAQGGDENVIPLLWAAGLDGVITTPTNTLSRALAGINQAFVQSPYLRVQ